LRCFFSASWTIAQSVFVSLWCSSLISNHPLRCDPHSLSNCRLDSPEISIFHWHSS
jgi:hypothetical protein